MDKQAERLLGYYQKTGKKYWSLERIKAGFEEFYRVEGRYPTALEIDAFDKLPSSRQLQRSYGGLVKVRQLIGLSDTNLSVGKNRERIATKINRRAGYLERDMEKALVGHFGEPFVHVEKRFGKTGKQRLDFFVYHKGGTFGVDVFYAESLGSFKGGVNIKGLAYKDYDGQLFLVCLNPSITHGAIDKFVSNKKNSLRTNIRVMNVGDFLEMVRDYKNLSICSH